MQSHAPRWQALLLARCLFGKRFYPMPMRSLRRLWLLLAAVLLVGSTLLAVPSFPRVATAAPAGAPLPTRNSLVTQSDILTTRITRSGLVTIPATALSANGWLTDQILAANVHVWTNGNEVPIAIAGSTGGMLTGATLRFIGHATTSRYTRETVYWLSHDTTAGLRAPVALAPGDPLRWDEDAVYNSLFAGPTGDRWFGREVLPSHTVTATLTLPTRVPAGTRLEVGLIGEELRDHTLAIKANGSTLGTLSWQDVESASVHRPQAQMLDLTLPSALPAGTVRFDLTLTSQGLPTDAVLIDSLELPTVRPAYSATPIVPSVTAVRPLDLSRGPAAEVSGADYLIITHSAFADTLAPLVAAKQQQGKTVAVVDVQDAYNIWSYGARDPEAIRSLIRTAAASWHPAPQAVLLVGAGTVRMRVADGQADTTFIPPYLVDTDPWLGEIACDTCYTRLDSPDPLDDPLPDIPIGRLPVRTSEEAATVVAKTVTALTAPPSGSWQQQAIILADNDREADGTPDKVGTFAQTAEAARALLPAAWQTTRVYYAPDRPTAAPFYTDALTARCAFFRALDGSTSDRRCPSALTTGATTSGAALLLYVGHASPWQWATTALDGDPPYLYTLYDTDRLANGDRLPILLAMSCLTGSFANPDLLTTDERLLVHRGGGDVASLSSSGLVIDAGQAAMSAGALPVLLQGGTLGAAHLAGLRALVEAGVGTSLAYSFNVLGDPEITLPQTRGGTAYLPVVVR